MLALVKEAVVRNKHVGNYRYCAEQLTWLITQSLGKAPMQVGFCVFDFFFLGGGGAPSISQAGCSRLLQHTTRVSPPASAHLPPLSPNPPHPKQVMAQLQEDIDDCDRRGGRDASVPAGERLEDFAAVVAAAEGGRDVRDAVAALLA